MQQASLGTNCNGPSLESIDPRHQSPTNDGDGILMRNDVIVKSEISTTENEQITEICMSDKDIRIKQEAPEDDVVQQDLSTKTKLVGCHQEHHGYRANSQRPLDSRHNDAGYQDERKEAYTSSFSSNVTALGVSVAPTMTSKSLHRTNPFDNQSIDLSRMTNHQQQYSRIQHPAYRTPVPTMSTPPSGVFGFPNFCGPPPPDPRNPATSAPQQQAPFTNSSSSSARHHTVGKHSRDKRETGCLDEAVSAYRQNAVGMLNEAFLRDYQNELNDFHHHGKGATNFSFPMGYSTAGTFRPSLARAYAHHQGQNNNGAYKNQQQQQYFSSNNSATVRQNNNSKWNNNSVAGKAIHPPSPNSLPAWLMRPEIPPITSMSNHPTNPSALSNVSSKTCGDTTRGGHDSTIDVSKVHGQTPTICTSIRCTVNGCLCDSFTPGKRHLRYCDNCHHGWVLHALARLSSLHHHHHHHQQNQHQDATGVYAVARPASDCNGGDDDVATGPRSSGREDKSAVGRARQRLAKSGAGVDRGGGLSRGGEDAGDAAEKEVTRPASETVEPTAVFDVASLVLYGSRALPIRLKILLDQLFNQLPHAKVTRLLAAFGWTHEDYTRGYILQDSQNPPSPTPGSLLDRWSICSAEEEPLVLQQFLRFPETRPFVQQLLLAAGTPASDAMSPSRRPSPPTMPLAHLPPSLHMLHCRLPGSRLPPPLPPPPQPLTSQQQLSASSSISHPSMSPSASKHHYSPVTLNSASNCATTNSSSHSSLDNANNLHLTVSPLNRLQSMQPFDFRELGSLGLPGFPMPPHSLDQFMQNQRKSMRNHPQSPHSPPHHGSSQLRPPMPVAPISASALAFGHPLAVAGSSGALPPNFPAHFSHPSMAKLSGNATAGLGMTGPIGDAHSVGEKSSDFGSEDDEDDDENSGSALNLSRRDSLTKHQQQQQNHHHHHHHHHQQQQQQQQQQHQHADKQRLRSLSLQSATAPLGRPPGLPGRKSHSPGKRSQWGTTSNLPPNLGTPFINPTTGKKRVQCNVCMKTFCDKGALKIHFSAVHLREMHQCTVKGCNTKFSSRRSRNRHSANPNPKLHSPHLRRKISPHDGRSSMAHALVLPQQIGLPVPPSGLNHLPFGSFPLLTPPPDLRSPASLCALDFKHLDLSSTQSQAMSYDEAVHQRMITTTAATTTGPSTIPMSLYTSTTPTTTNTHIRGSSSTASTAGASPTSQTPSIILEGEEDDDDDEDDDDEEGIVIVGDEELNLSSIGRTIQEDDEQTTPYSLAKRPKLSHDGADEDLASNPDSIDDTDSMSTLDHQSVSFNAHTASSASLNARGVRKRKSQHPTRCAMPTEVHSSSTDGDSSNDGVFQDQPEDMSMSRLEAEQRKNTTPSPKSISREGDSSSRSPGTIERERRKANSFISAGHGEIISLENKNDENRMNDHQDQEEPRDLSSRASSSARSPTTVYSPQAKNVSSTVGGSSPTDSEARYRNEALADRCQALNDDERLLQRCKTRRSNDESPENVRADEKITERLSSSHMDEAKKRDREETLAREAEAATNEEVRKAAAAMAAATAMAVAESASLGASAAIMKKETIVDEDEGNDEDEDEDDDAERLGRKDDGRLENREGERTDVSPSRVTARSIGGIITHAKDELESHDSSNALRQLESLSQGRMMMTATRTIPSRILETDVGYSEDDDDEEEAVATAATGPSTGPIGIISSRTVDTRPASRHGRISISPISTSVSPTSIQDNNNSSSNNNNNNNNNSSITDIYSRGSRSSSVSPSATAMDTDNSLITYARFENGGFVSTQEVPLDRDNPRRCTACGKVFQNHFGVKTHYQNVHLKLMHRCSVDGCNAAFPSKRSRDRHSANLNLHRKLLSTSSSPPLSSSLPTSLSPRMEDTAPTMNPLLHNDLLARWYADSAIGGLTTGYSMASVDLAARIPPSHLLMTPHLGAGFPGLSTFASHLIGLNGITQQRLSHLDHLTRISQERPIADHDESSPITTPQTIIVKPDEDARCTIPGCGRIFVSRAVRDAHSRDPQAHKDTTIMSSSVS